MHRRTTVLKQGYSHAHRIIFGISIKDFKNIRERSRQLCQMRKAKPAADGIGRMQQVQYSLPQRLSLLQMQETIIDQVAHLLLVDNSQDFEFVLGSHHNSILSSSSRSAALSARMRSFA